MKVDHGVFLSCGFDLAIQSNAIVKLDAIAWSSPHQLREVNGGPIASGRIDRRLAA